MSGHTCSYYCDQPECIRSQRDFLRDLAEQNAAPHVMDEDNGGTAHPPTVAAPTPVGRLLEKARSLKWHDALTLKERIAQLEHELAAARLLNEGHQRLATQYRERAEKAEATLELVVEDKEAIRAERNKAEAALTEARAEIARLREDASRYRWLKENIKTKRWQHTHDIFSSFETLDTAIDAARKETK